MRRVTVAARLPTTREAALDALTPERLLELEGTYEVTGVEETPDGWRVSGRAQGGDNRKVTVAVRELADGYAYESVEGGFLDVCRTTVRVDVPPADSEAPVLGDPEVVEAAGGTVRVRWESEFTTGGTFSFIVDWLYASNRRTELEQAARRLAADLGVVGGNSGESEAAE